MENYSTVNKDELVIEVKRTIRVGQILRINPSEAFLGIESGTIRVVGISRLEDISSLGEDIAKQAKAFYEISVEGLDIKEYKEEQAYKDRLEVDPWVAYRYDGGCVEVLPLEHFVAHTMMY